MSELLSYLMTTALSKTPTPHSPATFRSRDYLHLPLSPCVLLFLASKLPTLVSGTQISAPAMVWCRQCMLCSRDALCRHSARSPRQRLTSDFVGGVQLPTGSFLTPRLSWRLADNPFRYGNMSSNGSPTRLKCQQLFQVSLRDWMKVSCDVSKCTNVGACVNL